MSKPTAKPKVKRFKPFHAWINGKPSGPIVLGLTENEACEVKACLYEMEFGICYETGVLSRVAKVACKRASKILDKRNLRPLSAFEYGEIRDRQL